MSVTFSAGQNVEFFKSKRRNPCKILWALWTQYIESTSDTRLSHGEFETKQVERIKRILNKKFVGLTRLVRKNTILDLLLYFSVTNLLDFEVVCLGFGKAFELYYYDDDLSFRLKVEHNLGMTSDDGGRSLFYFLRRASTARYTVNGVRLQDFLLYIYRRNGYKKLTCEKLYTLVRFGTRDLQTFPPRRECNCNIYGQRTPQYPLLDLLSSLFKELYHHSQRRSHKTIEREARFLMVLKNTKLIFRSILTFPGYDLPNCNGAYFSDFGFVATQMTEAFDLMRSKENSLDLADFEERAKLKVTSLAHLCRMSIRKRLYENWNLPTGIYQMNLPGKIRRFLDLRI